MIFYIPIEPYGTRYTADWIKQFETEFANNNVSYTTIKGIKTSDKVTNGGVLDACGTHLYKFSQLSTIIEKINNGEVSDNDWIFFADLWFPGIESLFYIRNMLNLKFKISGILHAGTYDKADFTYRNNMREWGKYSEASWLVGVDKIFVATEFHKNLLLSNSVELEGLSDKIFVTGLPFYADSLINTYPLSKENKPILVFPHRLDAEKHPEMFDELVTWLKNKSVDFIPIKTIIETNSREEYFSVLAKSKVMVSFADQETFGYSTLESMALGNIVIVPNRLSYTETVPVDNRYNSKEECFTKVLDALLNYSVPVNYSLDKWEHSVKNMLTEMEC